MHGSGFWRSYARLPPRLCPTRRLYINLGWTNLHAFLQLYIVLMLIHLLTSLRATSFKPTWSFHNVLTMATVKMHLVIIDNIFVISSSYACFLIWIPAIYQNARYMRAPLLTSTWKPYWIRYGFIILWLLWFVVLFVSFCCIWLFLLCVQLLLVVCVVHIILE